VDECRPLPATVTVPPLVAGTTYPPGNAASYGAYGRDRELIATASNGIAAAVASEPLVTSAVVPPAIRGLHSSTFQLNLRRFGHTSPCSPV
jgi:hypothetical protein